LGHAKKGNPKTICDNIGNGRALKCLVVRIIEFKNFYLYFLLVIEK